MIFGRYHTEIVDRYAILSKIISSFYFYPLLDNNSNTFLKKLFNYKL